VGRTAGFHRDFDPTLATFTFIIRMLLIHLALVSGLIPLSLALDTLIELTVMPRDTRGSTSLFLEFALLCLFPSLFFFFFFFFPIIEPSNIDLCPTLK
jgi:hypothetical protein